MNWYTTNEYDRMITRADWELNGMKWDLYWAKQILTYIPDYTYMWYEWEIIPCNDCPAIDELLEETDFHADWLNEVRHPGYGGLATQNEYDLEVYRLDECQATLNAWYPLV